MRPIHARAVLLANYFGECVPLHYILVYTRKFGLHFRDDLLDFIIRHYILLKKYIFTRIAIHYFLFFVK